MTLTDALTLVDLEPGRTYRCQVNGLDVEVRVWNEKSSSGQVTKVDSLLQFMEPFRIEECDLAPGDLSDVDDDMKLLSPSVEADAPDTPKTVTKAKEE